MNPVSKFMLRDSLKKEGTLQARPFQSTFVDLIRRYFQYTTSPHSERTYTESGAIDAELRVSISCTHFPEVLQRV